ncbi:prolyl aminopeptidase-like protein [Hyaloscypha hepaticicola]|uniref:Prolyl aminopeptidase-like protein n=1 Tax=Hyaloscypha hepaticicola TaxID=2082293 RepID=A0A2J6PIY7_9HELO|nr:prolyl aminopeptidase-like protein [Hyaloscypha hepaticicola]
MGSQPEFIIVPGAWHSPESFKPTSDILEQKGYAVHGVNLKCYGASPPLRNFDPDVQVIRETVNKVLSSGKDAVIIYHSYGSVPGSEALSEYMKELEGGNRKEGWGKIQRLVFCCAFVLPEGGSLMAALQYKDLPWFIVKGDEVLPDTPEKIFYNDLSAEVAAPYIAALKPHSYRTFSSQQSVAPWKVIPSTYILCENDQAIPVQAQEGMLANAHQMAPGSFDVIERCSASHSPFISQPEWLADKLIKGAGGA